jgi:hypothetical protein
MHTCNIVVPGLPSPLVGHIVPNLAIALLIGICLLCNAGCIVVFDKYKCDVWYNGKIILTEPCNKSTKLWTLPLVAQDQHMSLNTAPPVPRHTVPLNLYIASFTHSVRTRVNTVKFAHQLLGNPCISTLLKAIQRGFIWGCPNTSKKLVLKYLNLSPATAKGHMKRPRHGIHSTTPKTAAVPPLHVIIDTLIVLVPPLLLVASNDTGGDWIEPPLDHQPGPNVNIDDNGDGSVANIFAFGVFADKHSSIVYHNLTGLFLLMSLDGSVCFFVLYHYKSNCIIADPIMGLDDKSIFKA